MRLILKIFCLVLFLLCLFFPFAYRHSSLDKKELRVSHILVNTLAEAEKIKKQLDEGKSFEDMAEKYSKCVSKQQKGNLGNIVRKKTVKDFENAAFNMELKKVSEPVKTEFGWHLIKIYDIKYYSDKDSFLERYFG